MKTKIYKEIASRINSIGNCEKAGLSTYNREWKQKHEDVIDYIQDNILPSGSGIDCGCKIDTTIADVDNINVDKLVIHSEYHTMDENGMYGRWITFRVVVRPSLQFGIVLNIMGNFGKNQDLKDYLYDVFNEALEQEIDTDTLDV